jgi:hypothetical protein
MCIAIAQCSVWLTPEILLEPLNGKWRMEDEKWGSIRPFAEEDNGKGLGKDFDVKQE